MRIFAFLKHLADLAASLVLVLLGVRLAFKLFEANENSPLVNGMYRLSDPVLAPVRKVFADQRLEGGAVVEYSTVLAVALVAIAGFLLVQLLSALEAAATRARTSTENAELEEGPRGYGRRSTDQPGVRS